MTGTAVREAGEDGRLRHNWVERNAFEVYGVISRKGGKVNVFVGASGFPVPHVRIGSITPLTHGCWTMSQSVHRCASLWLKAGRVRSERPASGA